MYCWGGQEEGGFVKKNAILYWGLKRQILFGEGDPIKKRE